MTVRDMLLACFEHLGNFSYVYVTRAVYTNYCSLSMFILEHSKLLTTTTPSFILS
jgi:hypothetical protein